MASTDVRQRDNQTVETTPAVEARQGVISGRVVTVLAISLSLSIAALGVAWLTFGH
jgi:uncharacterized membrane protein